ncbi:MAG: energy transducer TonB [Bacteroidaceae bacterium]|nr:energy transducer TonB [Bacteroidaceae bacterium]
MGSFVIYILEWTLCLSAFLLLYKMCFSGSTFHRFNRLFLLGSVVVAAMLPMIHITTSEEMEPIAEVCRLNTEELEPLPVAETIQMQVAETQEQLSTLNSQLSTSQKVFLAIALTYLIYILIQVVGWMRSFVKMMLFLRGKRTRRVGRWIRLVVHDEEYGPFSWMNYMVISEKENGFARRASMRHELSHIVLMHHLDLVFLLLCTLVNPVCWFIMKEIKMVHEYEADDEVINHYHIQSRDYQRLLVLRTVGAEAYALASSFNLNIKKRIIMMKKKQSTWWRMMWIAVTLPLVGIALTAFSKPKEALKEVVDSSVTSLSLTLPSREGTVSEVIETQAPTPVEEAENAVEEIEAIDDVKPGDMITGCVTDDKNMPVMMVNIFEKDEFGRIVAHAVSDLNGDFAFKLVNPQHKLTVSCPGFATQTLDIKDKEVNVTLKHNAKLDGATVYTAANAIREENSHFKDEALPQDGTFQVVEKMAAYPGGAEALKEYINMNLRYPVIAKENQVEADIIVEFTVGKTGLVSSARVVECSSSSPLVTAEVSKAAEEYDPEAVETMKAYYDAVEALKEEAVHLVRSMSRWEPSRRNGLRFETEMTIPISFKLMK